MNDYVKQKLTERIDELFSGKVIPRYMPWKLVNGLGVNYFTEKAYQGINRLFLGNGEWATFLQLQSHNATLNKGAKSRIVVCPILVKINGNKNKKEDDTKTDEEKKEDKDITILRGIKLARVFNIKDTNLPSKIKVDKEPLVLKDDEKMIIDQIFELAKKRNIKIEEGYSNSAYYSLNIFENSDGSYDEKVVIPSRDQFSSGEMFIKTLLHEIGHATGSPSRLNRNKKSFVSFGSNDYAKEELVAEIFAFSAMAELGISSPLVEDETIAYLNNWQRFCRDNINSFIRATNEADKALEYFFN